MPSRAEPLGNVVIEAWSNGIPVVASNTVGPLSLIADMETGVLFESENDRSHKKDTTGEE